MFLVFFVCQTEIVQECTYLSSRVFDINKNVSSETQVSATCFLVLVYFGDR